MKFKCLIILFILVISRVASLADVHTAASCLLADVSAAYNAASVGDVVAIPAGNCIWSSALNVDKSIIIRGAGADSTIINDDGSFEVTDELIYINLSSDVPVRVTGIYFKFSTNNPGARAIDINGKVDGSFGLTKIRIDHNKFEKGTRAVFARGWVYGVIDNNEFLNCNIAVGIAGDNNHSWGRAIEAGSENALFIEDNTFAITNDSDREPNELIYHQESARTVIRYNTFDGTEYTDGNSLFFDSHGNQNYYSGGGDFRGQPIIEVYWNEFHSYDTYRIFHIRGGSVLIHNNTMTNAQGSTSAIVLNEEESWQTAFFMPLATEWAAEDQIINSFIWNNTLNGNAITSVVVQSMSVPFIQEDKDYFMHAPAANGGKASYTERVGGDESFSASGANAYYPYIPYTYPHPLRRVAPSPPENLRNISQSEQ